MNGPFGKLLGLWLWDCFLTQPPKDSPPPPTAPPKREEWWKPEAKPEPEPPPPPKAPPNVDVTDAVNGAVHLGVKRKDAERLADYAVKKGATTTPDLLRLMLQVRKA